MLDLAGERTQYVYDARGNRIQEQDATGAITTYVFDANGRETRKTTTRTLADGTRRSVVESTAYDAEGRPTQTSNALGHTTRTVYNASGKPVEEIDALGRRTLHEYDARLNLTRTTYPDGTSETSTYDAENNLVARTDRQGRMTRTEYDALNRPVKVIQPDGAYTTTTYDAAGRVWKETDARGNTTQNTYDKAGRLIKVTNALGESTEFGYDANGNRTSLTDALGRTTRFEYDALNRLTRTVYPDQTQTLTSWTIEGRKESETDASGNLTRFGYDGKGQLTSVTQVIDGRELVTRYSCDEHGNKLTQQDAQGRITRWAYDDLGRQVSRTLPLGQTETFEYDAAGNVRKHTDFNGQTTLYAYDASNRETMRQYPDGTSVRTTYTQSGQIKTRTDYRGTDTYHYDALDRLTRIERPEGTIAYQYDRNGNRTQIATNHQIVGYQYDELNRLASVTDPRGKQTTYQFDAAGNKIRTSYPNNTTIEYAYDTLGRLTEIRHRRTTDGVVFAGFRYTLKANGQREKLEERDEQGPTRTLDYRYDSLQRLVQETRTEHRSNDEQTITTWVFDDTGNRLRQTVARPNQEEVTVYSYDDNDRLLTELRTTNGQQVYAKTYGYDDNGNTLSIDGGGETVEYGWDVDNRLRTFSKNGQALASFGYDADGIRTVKRVVGGEDVHFLVDPNQRYAQVVEENDEPASQPETAYVHGDQLITLLRVGQGSFYHSDALGSTRRLTNDYATVTDDYAYDAYGELASGTTARNRYLFAGEQVDEAPSLTYLRARYSSPALGRFISVDPAGAKPCDPLSLHRYLYGQANPVLYVDPAGLYVGVGPGGFVALLDSAFAGMYARASSAKRAHSNYNRLIRSVCTTTSNIGKRLPGHHSLPKYLGGPLEQELAFIPELVHRQLHSLLTIILRLNNVPVPSGIAFSALGARDQAKVWDILLEVTKAVDRACSTVSGYTPIEGKLRKLLNG